MSLETKPKMIGLVVVALLAVAGAGVAIWMNRDENPSGTITQSSPTTTPSSTPVPANATYKDGTYTADGLYHTSNGDEKIGVTLTIVKNTITNVSIQTYGNGTGEQERQIQFKDRINAIVVGKKVNDVSVSQVSGSSLISSGFTKALEIIKSDAQV